MLKKKWLYMIILVIMTTAACSNTTSNEAKETKPSNGSSSTNPSSMDDLDQDDPMTPFIKEGKEVFTNTNTVIDETGNELSCISCHADDGLSKNDSMIGVTSKYPKYQPREGVVLTLGERINSCMVRSLNGEKLDYDGEKMRSLIAYLTYISEDVASDNDIEKEEKGLDTIPEPSIENGEKLYEEKNCLTCHATDGSGTGADSGPALWGDGSFNDGASLGRVYPMAAYIKNNMPPDDAGSLTDQEAADLTAFLLSQKRPEWKRHDEDWAKGDRPNDIITKEKRKEIQDGKFEWSQLNN